MVILQNGVTINAQQWCSWAFVPLTLRVPEPNHSEKSTCKQNSSESDYSQSELSMLFDCCKNKAFIPKMIIF